MILDEILPSRSSRRFKRFFDYYYFLAKTSVAGPPPLLFMNLVYSGLHSER